MEANENTPPVIVGGQPPLLYADNLLQVQFGESTSKLTFGLEIGSGMFSQVAVVVIPTRALVEGMTFLKQTIQSQPEVAEKISSYSEQVTELISKV